jgi:hypothetical protein
LLLVRDADNPGHSILNSPDLNDDDEPIPGSEENFRPKHISLWPLHDTRYDGLCLGELF